MEERKNKQGVFVKVPVIRNTITYEVGNNEEAQKIVTDINENGKPRNNVKKWYLSNIT
jgi:hypothetical protein